MENNKIKVIRESLISKMQEYAHNSSSESKKKGDGGNERLQGGKIIFQDVEESPIVSVYRE